MDDHPGLMTNPHPTYTRVFQPTVTPLQNANSHSCRCLRSIKKNNYNNVTEVEYSYCLVSIVYTSLLGISNEVAMTIEYYLLTQ